MVKVLVGDRWDPISESFHARLRFKPPFKSDFRSELILKSPVIRCAVYRSGRSFKT